MTTIPRSYPVESSTFPGRTERNFYRTRDGYVTSPLRSEMTPHLSNRVKSFVGVGRSHPAYGPSHDEFYYPDAPNTEAFYYNQPRYIWSAGAAANNAAYSQLIDRLHSKAALLVTLAERREAAQMVTGRLLSIAKTIRDFRRGKVTRAVRTLFGNRNRRLSPRDISSTWLEIQYGWKPLISDIHSGLELLDSPYPMAKVTGSGKTGGETNRGGGSYNWQFEGVRYYTCRKTAYVVVDNPLEYRLSQAGVTNPLVVAWELVPFSFVIDWFVNVGDWLASQDDFRGLTIVKACESMLAVCEEDQWYNSPYYLIPAKGHVSAVTYHRRLGISGPTLHVPPVSQGINWMRAANAAALIHQLLK